MQFQFISILFSLVITFPKLDCGWIMKVNAMILMTDLEPI